MPQGVADRPSPAARRGDQKTAGTLRLPFFPIVGTCSTSRRTSCWLHTSVRGSSIFSHTSTRIASGSLRLTVFQLLGLGRNGFRRRCLLLFSGRGLGVLGDLEGDLEAEVLLGGAVERLLVADPQRIEG